MLELTVKTLDSQNHSFTLCDEATVLMLKQSIFEKMEVPLETQRLIYHGKVLQDDKKLTDYGDVNGKVIHLVQRAPPSSTSRPGDTSRSRSSSSHDLTNAAPNRRPGIYRRLDGGNATYLGALTIPADFIDPQGLIQPSTNQMLSRSRVNVARRMLRLANNAMARLESNDSSPTSETNETNPSASTSQSQTNTLDTGTRIADDPLRDSIRLVDDSFLAFHQPSSSDSSMASAARVTNSGHRNAISADVNVNIDVALEVEVVTDSSTGDQSSLINDRGAENRGNNDSRAQMGVDSLANLFQNLNEANRRLQPLLQQCQQLLSTDPVFDESNPAANSQRLFNGVSETLHLLAHACHAASDLIVDFNDAPPRALRCRPVIVQHSAILENSFPIHLNQVNFNRPPNGNRGNPPDIPNAATTNQQRPQAQAVDAPTSSSSTVTPTPTSSTQAPFPTLLTSALTSAFAASAAAEAAAAAAAAAETSAFAASAAEAAAAAAAAASTAPPPTSDPPVESAPAATIVTPNVAATTTSATNAPAASAATTATALPLPQAAFPIIFGGMGGIAGAFSGGPSQGPNPDNFEIFVNFSPDGHPGGIVQAMQAVTAEIIQNRFMRPPGSSSNSNTQSPGNQGNQPAEQSNSSASTTSASSRTSHAVPNTRSVDDLDSSLVASGRISGPSGDRILRVFHNGAPSTSSSASTPPSSDPVTNSSQNAQSPRGGSRRRFNLGNTIHNFLTSTPFDLFLPCASHHIRSSSTNNVMNGRPLGNRATVNIDISSTIDRPEGWRPNSEPSVGPRRADEQTSAPSSASYQLSGNLFLSVLSNILGRWYLNQTSSFPNRNESVADVVRRVGNAQANSDSLIIDLLMTLAQHVRFLDTLAMASSSEGLETLANLLRPTISTFANLRLLSGDPPTEANITRATDRLSSEIREYIDLGLVTTIQTIRLRETVDLMATINRCNQSHLPGIITLIIESANESNYGTFGTNLIRRLTIYFRELLAIIVHCCTDGPHDFRVLIRNFVSVSTRGAPTQVQEDAEQYLMENLREFFAELDVSDDRIQRYLVYRAPPVSQQEPMETDSPAADATAWGVNDNLATSIASPEKEDEPLAEVLTAMETESLPEIIIGSESWHNALPAEWVPVIARDAQRQRHQRRQSAAAAGGTGVGGPKPLSDAYLSGMPPKRRKLITTQRPQLNDDFPSTIAEGVRDAIRASGVISSSSSVDRIVAEAARDPALQRAFQQQERTMGTRVIRSDPDFTPSRFPNAHKYFKH